MLGQTTYLRVAANEKGAFGSPSRLRATNLLTMYITGYIFYAYIIHKKNHILFLFCLWNISAIFNIN